MNGAAQFGVAGTGLGLRRALLTELESGPAPGIDFWEVAPENWLDLGGALGRRFRAFCERHTLLCHGLALNLGGQAPLDQAFLRRLRVFLDQHHARGYSEHLSYCADEGQLYDLLPIPFTSEAVRHVATRIQRVQDVLERRIAIENVSYYCAPGAELSELAFLTAVLAEADCELLLDVNNVYVNSHNHGYDAREFLRGLPVERIAYLHIAGHHRRAHDLLVDTHAAPVDAEVWALLDETYARCGPRPTVLERDAALPPLAELCVEAARIGACQARHVATARRHAGG
ncbi:MAG: DUF692 domain-containing protein [Gammaproteobacteria bacterium]